MRKTLTILFLSAFCAVAAGATDFNVDLTNKGPFTADDVGIVVKGTNQVQGTYDGWANTHFRNVSHFTSFGNTVFHWQNPWDETKVPPIPTRIPPGAVIHVGITMDGDMQVVDLYWTDEYGARIPGADIAVTGGHIDRAGITFSNFLNQSVSISGIQYTYRSRPFALAELVRGNTELMRSLVPLASKGITLAPGQSLTVPFPSPLPEGATAIVVYGQDGSESAASALGFLQDTP